MKEFSLKTNVIIFLVCFMVGCDQAQLPWTESTAVKLTEEQIRVKIGLQHELAGLRERLLQTDAIIEKYKERVSFIRSEHRDKFINEQIELGSNPPLGSDQAKLAIVEFTDYQCSDCARHVSEVMPLIKRYYIEAGGLKYYLRDYPLVAHSQAKYAAVVSLCAGEQGRYWQMHDLLFENQKHLKPHVYLRLSHEVGLNPTLFSDCLTNTNSVKKVDDDTIYGKSLSINTMPKIFIGLIEGDKISNVIMVEGAQSYAYFSEIIDLLKDLDRWVRATKLSFIEKGLIKRELLRVESELNIYK